MWYIVKIAFSTESDKGKTKIEKLNYLVEDETTSSAENKVKKKLIDEDEINFEIKSVSESKIYRVI